MDPVSQYMIISFVLALEFAIVIGQTILISRVHRYTMPWVLLAAGFLLIGGRQTWSMIRIPIQAQELRSRGIQIPAIGLEQGLMIVTGILAGILFIAAFDLLRRRYQKLGI
jgi:hypothetical protein